MKLFGIMIILFFSMIVLPPIFRIHQITLFLNDTFTINGNHSQQIQITTTNWLSFKKEFNVFFNRCVLNTNISNARPWDSLSPRLNNYSFRDSTGFIPTVVHIVQLSVPQNWQLTLNLNGKMSFNFENKFEHQHILLYLPKIFVFHILKIIYFKQI